MRTAIVAMMTAGLLAAGVSAQTAKDHQHHFKGTEKWVRIFDDPAREEWQKPERVIDALKLAPDALVADIGAGTGYFTVRLAERLVRGHVYAVDVEPEMVEYVAERAKRAGLANVTAVQANEDDPKLPAKVDLVLLVDTYHHLPNPVAYFRRLASALKPGGGIAVVDFRTESPVGPARGRVTADTVMAELQAAGYVLAEEFGFLPYQFFHVYRPIDVKPTGK